MQSDDPPAAVNDRDASAFRCPTCRAVQRLSDECRRCHSDLRLLKSLAGEYEAERARCLAAVRAGRPKIARRHADACLFLRPDEPARSLAAVCALLDRDWPAALRAIRGAAASE
jgi:hypothetical protein